jgi:serine/threonine-protein kinase
VVRHLANGGMASVWEAHDELLDLDVAVKLLASHLGEDERARRRFQREARAAAGLSSHPHVGDDLRRRRAQEPRVHGDGDHARRDASATACAPGARSAHETALRWLREAAAALDAAHDGRRRAPRHQARQPAARRHDRLAVADFGIARLAWRTS